MAPTKKNTRGNKNTATIQREDPSMTEMRETTKERFELTKESIQVKATYQKSFVQLKANNKIIKSFLKEYGQHINIKELAGLVMHQGYKAEKTQELTLESLKKIFVAGKVFKTVTEIQKGTVYDSAVKKQVAMNDIDLSAILADIAKSDLKSFKEALKLVDESTYAYDESALHWQARQGANNHKDHMINYVNSLKKMDFPAFEANFFEPALLAIRSKTNISILDIVQKTKEAHEAFLAREALTDAMYKSSSAEVIEAINNDQYKCQNPNNDPEVTKDNNKVIQKISGEEANLNLPQETAIYSDFVFHSEHATSQCELQETLRLEKNFHAAKAVILAEQILRDCSQAQIKELNKNYDAEISEQSTSTAIAISTNNQEKCDKLEQNYHILDANIAFLFAYKTSDDAEILAAMEKVKPVVSIDTEGEATMSDTSLKSKHTSDSANIKGFNEIREDLSKQNENAVVRAIAGKENKFDLENDQISFYTSNESQESSTEEAVAHSSTCLGDVTDACTAGMQG